MPTRNYAIDTTYFTASKYATVIKGCTSWEAVNLGLTPVTVENILLPAALAIGLVGGSVSIGGNEGEIYSGKIQITFVGALSTPNVMLIQKYYNDER